MRVAVLLRLLLRGDVVVRLEDAGGVSLHVPLKRPAARDHDPRAVALCVLELSVPAPGAEQLGDDLV